MFYIVNEVVKFSTYYVVISHILRYTIKIWQIIFTSLGYVDTIFQILPTVYPALDTSDDEELIFKPRGKRKMDEAWCPKARVGPLVPKTDRPTREGTKKQSVEKVLEAAAAKRAGLPVCYLINYLLL